MKIKGRGWVNHPLGSGRAATLLREREGWRPHELLWKTSTTSRHSCMQGYAACDVLHDMCEAHYLAPLWCRRVGGPFREGPPCIIYSRFVIPAGAMQLWLRLWPFLCFAVFSVLPTGGGEHFCFLRSLCFPPGAGSTFASCGLCASH